LSESLEKFSVAVVATDDGRFAYQVFLAAFAAHHDGLQFEFYAD
jgi:hypothetical protein